MSRFDKVQFSALPPATLFRFHARGPLLTKTSASAAVRADGSVMQVTADAEVLPEDDALAAPAPTANPFGSANRVTFLPGYVRLDGAFTADQLAAVLADMKARKP